MLSYADSYLENRDDSKDIVQDVFIYFFSMLRSGKYTEQGKLFHLLLRITHHRIGDFFDRKKLRDDAFTPLQDKEKFDAAEQPDEDSFSREEMKWFREKVHRLKPMERKVLIMRYHGRHWEDIGKKTDMNANSASHMYSRLVKQLRKENERNDETRMM